MKRGRARPPTMQLVLRDADHAARLLVEYNHGRHALEEELALIARGKALAAADFRRLGLERYYRESEAIKYDLLDWHVNGRR